MTNSTNLKCELSTTNGNKCFVQTYMHDVSSHDLATKVFNAFGKFHFPFCLFELFQDYR